MRMRLLNAVLKVHGAGPPGARPPIEAVLAEAGVARATFYKYFESVDDAVGVLDGVSVEDTIAQVEGNLGDAEHSPAFALIVSVRIVLARSARDAGWFTFIARRDAFGTDTPLRALIETPIRGMADADPDTPWAGDVTLALCTGLVFEGMRSIADHADGADHTFTDRLCLAILANVGVLSPEAEGIVDRAAQVIGAYEPPGPK